MADDVGHVVPGGLDGLLILGTFLRVEPTRDGRGRQVVIQRDRWDGETWEQSFLYDEFDRDSGAQTDVSEQLSCCTRGDFVALRPKVRVSQKGSPWYLVTGVHVLDADVLGS